MKIDDASKKDPSIRPATSQSRPGRTEAKADVEKTTSDNVTLSAKAQAMASALTETAGSPGVFDTAKVNAIKEAIANGQFKVNAERVADGLIDTVKDLISTRKG